MHRILIVLALGVCELVCDCRLVNVDAAAVSLQETSSISTTQHGAGNAAATRVGSSRSVGAKVCRSAAAAWEVAGLAAPRALPSRLIPSMHTGDLLVLLVAAGSVLFSFQTAGSMFLKPAWSFTLEADAGIQASGEAPLPVPAPVVADLDDDGRPEVLVCTRDGRLLLLDPAPPARMAAARATKWRQLPVRAEASLRSHVGLEAGRRPVALQAGVLRAVHPPERRLQLVVVLTEDWSVLAFDHELRPQWEHSLGSQAAERPRRFVEASILVSSAQVYAGDEGDRLRRRGRRGWRRRQRRRRRRRRRGRRVEGGAGRRARGAARAARWHGAAGRRGGAATL